MVGIVSWGPSICAHETLPGISTDVTKYQDWILSIVDGNGSMPDSKRDTTVPLEEVETMERSVQNFNYSRQSVAFIILIQLIISNIL